MTLLRAGSIAVTERAIYCIGIMMTRATVQRWNAHPIQAEFTFLTIPIYYAMTSAAYSLGPCLSGEERRVGYGTEETNVQMIFFMNISTPV